jgi:protein TonB
MSRISFHHRQFAVGATVAMVLISGGISTALADSPPKVDRSYPAPSPDYPALAQDNGEQGDVLVDVFVGSNGKPSKFKINQSSGFADLDNAAAEAVANWRYIPAVENGDRTSGWTTVKIHFELPHPEPAAATTAAPQH